MRKKEVVVMRLPGNLSDQVVEAMRQAAQDIILPRFQHLASDEIEEKSPGELVTIADQESEQFLSECLLRILPGSFVIGEELAASHPEVMSRIGSGKVWLIDPLDGTANFVSGKPLFSIMVALLSEGQPIFSFMLNPVTGVLHHAEQGNGAWRNDVRLSASANALPALRLKGAMLNRLMPSDLKDRMQAKGKLLGECLPGFGCAGIEYPAIVEGDEDFAIFWRSLPWDHAPGALLVREAGGVSRRLDGSDYKPADAGKGLIVASNADIYEELCQVVIGRDAW